MTFKLPDLPYDASALEPHISAKTVEYHYGKHHQGYIDGMNKIIEGTHYADRKLGDLVHEAGVSGDTDLFNNAAQSWNHDFLWKSMSPDGGGDPEGKLAELIDAAFGDADGFRKAFKEAATGQFGSGWGWLVVGNGGLQVYSTPNQDSPYMKGDTPILGVDVWEHAYYLHYQNKRGDYVSAWWNVIDWDAVAENYANAQ